MLNPRDLLVQVIRPALAVIGYDGAPAEALVLATAIAESGLTRLVQDGGPALGLWQMEEATEIDIHTNFLDFRPGLSEKVLSLQARAVLPSGDELAGNLYYGAAMCRIKYLRSPKALPADPTDVTAMGVIWKAVYNGPTGAGTIADFVARVSPTWAIHGLLD